MWILRMIVILIVISIVVGFSMLNSQQIVSVDLLYAKPPPLPLVYVTYWAFLAGMIVTFFLGVSYVIKLHTDLREERKTKQRLTVEITALRNRAIDGIDELE